MLELSTACLIPGETIVVWSKKQSRENREIFVIISATGEPDKTARIKEKRSLLGRLHSKTTEGTNLQNGMGYKPTVVLRAAAAAALAGMAKAAAMCKAAGTVKVGAAAAAVAAAASAAVGTKKEQSQQR